MRLYIYLYVCGRGDGAQIVGNEHERSDCWKPPFYCWFIFRRAESDSESLTPKCLFNADLTACGSRCASRGITSLSLSRYACCYSFLSFFFSKGFKLVKFDFSFLLTLRYFWKIFCVILQRLLYWFSLRGSPRDMETHKDLFLWLLYREKESIITRRHRGWHHSHGRKIKKKSPFLRLCRESVSLDPRQLTPRILSWAYIHTHKCVCDTYLSLSHWMVIVKLCKTFFWKVKGRLFSLSSLVGFSTVF